MARIEMEEGVTSYLFSEMEWVKPILREVNEQILVEAKGEAPKDTHQLANSGHIVETKKGYRIVFRAFNGDYNYAIRQHNDTSLNHPNGGKAYFLRDPALRWGQLLPRIIAVRARQGIARMRGGG